MLEIENMEMALTILSIFMFEASSFHNQTSKSQKFLKEKTNHPRTKRNKQERETGLVKIIFKFIS